MKEETFYAVTLNATTSIMLWHHSKEANYGQICNLHKCDEEIQRTQVDYANVKKHLGKQYQTLINVQKKITFFQSWAVSEKIILNLAIKL